MRYDRASRCIVAVAALSLVLTDVTQAHAQSAAKRKPQKPAAAAEVMELAGIRFLTSPERAMELAKAEPTRPLFYWRVLGDPSGFM